jgi:hypothetical protein
MNALLFHGRIISLRHQYQLPTDRNTNQFDPSGTPFLAHYDNRRSNFILIFPATRTVLASQVHRHTLRSKIKKNFRENPVHLSVVAVVKPPGRIFMKFGMGVLKNVIFVKIGPTKAIIYVMMSTNSYLQLPHFF